MKNLIRFALALVCIYPLASQATAPAGEEKTAPAKEDAVVALLKTIPVKDKQESRIPGTWYSLERSFQYSRLGSVKTSTNALTKFKAGLNYYDQIYAGRKNTTDAALATWLKDLKADKNTSYLKDEKSIEILCNHVVFYGLRFGLTESVKVAMGRLFDLAIPKDEKELADDNAKVRHFQNLDTVTLALESMTVVKGGNIAKAVSMVFNKDYATKTWSWSYKFEKEFAAEKAGWFYGKSLVTDFAKDEFIVSTNNIVTASFRALRQIVRFYAHFGFNTYNDLKPGIDLIKDIVKAVIDIMGDKELKLADSVKTLNLYLPNTARKTFWEKNVKETFPMTKPSYTIFNQIIDTAKAQKLEATAQEGLEKRLATLKDELKKQLGFDVVLEKEINEPVFLPKFATALSQLA